MRPSRLAPLFGVLAAAMLMAGAGAVHPSLRYSVPAGGDTLAMSPRELRLTFDEPLELELSELGLIGPDGLTIALGPLASAPDSASVLLAAISGSLAPGDYTVTWMVAGADGHPIRGHFGFTVAPAPSDTAAAGQPAPPTEHHPAAIFPESEEFSVGHPLFVAVRWLMLTGLLIIIGTVAFERLVLRALERRGGAANPALMAVARPRAATLGLAGTVLLLISVIARLLAQTYAMDPTGEAFAPSFMGTMLLRTAWGWGWLLQLGGATLVLAGFVRARRAPPVGWNVALLGALILAFTPGLSGHAIAVGRLMPLPVLADGLHVIGAGGWLGTLLVVAMVGIPSVLADAEAERGAGVAALVNAFSRVALCFAGIAGVTGVFAAWLHLGTLPALWQSAYGRTLLIKLGILSVVVATGFYNWRVARPALGDDIGTRRVRRSATAELVVAAAVILVTAVLMATPPPADAAMISP